MGVMTARNEMHIAECGAWINGNTATCSHTQQFISEELATKHLMEHLRTVHGASTTTPSETAYGWVRPYPPPTNRGTHWPYNNGDELIV